MNNSKQIYLEIPDKNLNSPKKYTSFNDYFIQLGNVNNYIPIHLQIHFYEMIESILGEYAGKRQLYSRVLLLNFERIKVYLSQLINTYKFLDDSDTFLSLFHKFMQINNTLLALSFPETNDEYSIVLNSPVLSSLNHKKIKINLKKQSKLINKALHQFKCNSSNIHHLTNYNIKSVKNKLSYGTTGPLLRVGGNFEPYQHYNQFGYSSKKYLKFAYGDTSDFSTLVNMLIVEILLLVDQNQLLLLKGIKNNYTYRISKNIKEYTGELTTVFPTPFGDEILTIKFEKSRIMEAVLIDPRITNRSIMIQILNILPDHLAVPFAKINGYSVNKSFL